MSAVEQAIEDATTEQPWNPEKPIKIEECLSTGIPTLNLSLTGNIRRGLPRGFAVRYTGGTSTAKTAQMLTILAEAARDPLFDEYQLEYNDAERGANFDPRLFGKKLHDRLRWSHTQILDQMYLETIEAMQRGPIIKVVDSLDALMSFAEAGRLSENLKNLAKQKSGKKKKDADSDDEGDGPKKSFGDGKAIVNSQGMRQLLEGAHRTGSIIIFISQERIKIGAKSFHGHVPKTTAGGEAPAYYVSVELHTRRIGKIYKGTEAIDEHCIGVNIGVSVEKNRINGGIDQRAECSFYPASGFDQVGNMVDYGAKRWGVSGGRIQSPWGSVYREALIKKCLDPAKRLVLEAAIQKIWDEEAEEVRKLVARPQEYL